jgi:hypothetical protein
LIGAVFIFANHEDNPGSGYFNVGCMNNRRMNLDCQANRQENNIYPRLAISGNESSGMQGIHNN